MEENAQFHQHFMSAFLPKTLRKKVQTLYISTKMLGAKLSYEKAAHKMLVKLTQGFP
jgi:hypothetical protein